MAQQIIENNETGIAVRTALNDMFTELYSAVIPFNPIVIKPLSANTNVSVPAGILINQIYLIPETGVVNLRIGITPNGQEILADTVINFFQPIQAQQYFEAPGTLYFTFTSGSGSLNVYIYYINNLI